MKKYKAFKKYSDINVPLFYRAKDYIMEITQKTAFKIGIKYKNGEEKYKPLFFVKIN